jgi:uncharacterized protein
MANVFQKPVDIYKVSKENRLINGEIPIVDLKRIIADLGKVELGNLHVKLEFTILQRGVCLCCGHIEGKLPLECQRTLEIFDYEINHSFKVAISDNIVKLEALDDQYETFLFDGLAIAPIDLVEEELLLLLPIVPKKPLKDCKVDKTSAYYDAFSNEHVVEPKKENPFAVLSKLKKLN